MLIDLLLKSVPSLDFSFTALFLLFLLPLLSFSVFYAFDTHVSLSQQLATPRVKNAESQAQPQTNSDSESEPALKYRIPRQNPLIRSLDD